MPAIVLGSGITALGVTRCLGRAGIPVYWVSDRGGTMRSCRWCRRFLRDAEGGRDLGEFLRSLPIERAVLMPCSDHYVEAVTDLDGQLRQRFPSGYSDKQICSTFLDKRSLAEALCRCGVPHPRTIALDTVGDLGLVSDSDITDYFVKPCRSQAFFAQFGTKAIPVSSRTEAAECYKETCRRNLQVVLQEFIPGPASNHYLVDGFVDRQGRCRARLARRRIRMYPTPFGNSSYFTTVPLSEVQEAVRAIDKLVDRANLRGVFSAEFKLDSRDGEFKLLEVNVRPWWYIEFVALCGIDIASMAYQDALGMDVESSNSYPVGRSCVYPLLDLSACVALVRNGELSVQAWLKSWVEAYHATFRWDDPMPAFIATAGWILEQLRVLLRIRHNQ